MKERNNRRNKERNKRRKKGRKKEAKKEKKKERTKERNKETKKKMYRRFLVSQLTAQGIDHPLSDRVWFVGHTTRKRHFKGCTRCGLPPPVFKSRFCSISGFLCTACSVPFFLHVASVLPMNSNIGPV